MLVCAQSAMHQRQREAAGSVLVPGGLHVSLSARVHVPDSAAACLLVCRWAAWA